MIGSRGLARYHLFGNVALQSLASRIGHSFFLVLIVKQASTDAPSIHEIQGCSWPSIHYFYCRCLYMAICNPPPGGDTRNTAAALWCCLAAALHSDAAPQTPNSECCMPHVLSLGPVITTPRRGDFELTCGLCHNTFKMVVCPCGKKKDQCDCLRAQGSPKGWGACQMSQKIMVAVRGTQMYPSSQP